LVNSEIAIARVKQRVRQGGHDLPEATIKRRFESGLKNFHQHYKQCVDIWLHFDNSEHSPTLIDWSEK